MEIVQGKGWAQGSGCSEGSLTFGDVHCTDPDWGYIQTVSTQGLTAGCGGGSYCPDAAITRSTAAVLFMKAEHGGTYNPSCAGIFSDLPCTDGTAKYAEAAYNEAAMAACGTSPLRFCPTNSLTELDAAKADNKLWPSYKPISGGSLYTLRNTENQLVTEFADSMPSRDNVYIGNIAVASYLSKQSGGSGSWQFHASDHLGTVRLTVDGATIGTTLLESDKYWPYGDRLTPVTPPAQRVAFAAMERDLENNHFYDHARHHDFGLGRFTNVDRIAGVTGDPQTWNRYVYARGNPAKLIDRNGLWWSLSSTDPQHDFLKAALIADVRKPSFRADFLRIADAPREARLVSGSMNNKADTELKIRNHEAFSLHAGDTGGASGGGLQVKVDVDAIKAYAAFTSGLPAGVIDPSGQTTVAHETYHVFTGIFDSSKYEEGDKPTNETGPAQRFGESVFNEKADISEAEAKRLVEESLNRNPCSGNAPNSADCPK